MAATDPSPDAAPLPARFWWLKRLTMALLVWMAVLVALRYVAAAVVEKQLRSEIQRIKARGEPIAPADFAEPKLSDDENAAVPLARAGFMVKIDRQEENAWSFLPEAGPYTAVQLQTAKAVLERNRAALAMVREARGKTQAAWGVVPGEGIFWYGLHCMYHSDILKVAAIYAHQMGHDDEAVEYLRDLLMLAKALDQEPLPAALMQAAGMREYAAIPALAMASTLKINVAGQPARANAASEQQVRKLIEELLDETESPRSGFRWLLQAERMREQEFVRMMVDEPDSVQFLWSSTKMTKPRIWLLRPMLKRDAIRMLRMSEDALAAAGEGNFLAAMTRLGPSAKIKRSRSPIRLELVSGLAADYEWMFYRYYSVSQERRQAALKLAERLFEVKNGRLPRPDELAPAYLPSLPVDRMPASLTLAGRIGALKPTSRPGSN